MKNTSLKGLSASMINWNRKITFSLLLLVVGFYCCQKNTKEKVVIDQTIEDIDLTQITELSDYVKIITGYMDQNGLNDGEEGQIIRIFEKAVNDSILNELIFHLSQTQYKGSNVLLETYRLWDSAESETNKHRLGRIVKISF